MKSNMRRAFVIVTLLVVACAAPEASPSPSPSLSPTAEPTATVELSPPASPSPATLATPALAYVGSRNYRIDDDRFIAYELAITNLADYPAQLFVATELAPCLVIADAASNQPLAELCPLASLVQLAELSFSLPRGQAPPAAAYVELTDRRTGAAVRSGAVAIETVARETPTARPSPTPGADGWIGPELVSTRPYSDISLVVDDGGVAHVATVLNDAIFYVTNETGSWTRERLSRPSGADWDPSIALDDDGSLHVAFTRWPPEDPSYCPPDVADCFGPGPEGVYYSTNSSGSWSEPVPLGRRGGNSPSLVVRAGRVHLAYLGRWVYGELSGPGPVRYLTNGTGAWSDERVGMSYGSPVLRLDSDGVARLAYWDVDEDDEEEVYEPRLWYGVAETPSGSFRLEQLRGVPDAGWLGSLWLDTDGTGAPHLVAEVWSEDGDASHYWSLQDGRWSSPQALLPGDSLRQMKVDGNGAMHLLAADECCLHYLTNRSGAFDRHDLSSRSGWAKDVALDAEGRPHVLFVVSDEDGRSPELWYAIGPAF
jgi:hypothetical protein